MLDYTTQSHKYQYIAPILSEKILTWVILVILLSYKRDDFKLFWVSVFAVFNPHMIIVLSI